MCVFTIVCLYSASCQPVKEDMVGNDFRLFKNTLGWELAKAVKEQDTSNFEKIIKDSRINIDYEEDVFGQSLLQLAVHNNLDKSVKKLLELGADPNHSNDRHGETVMHNAVGIFQNNDDTLILSYLLEYGGNPNGKTSFTNYQVGGSRSVVSELCVNNTQQLNKLKLLVKNGANIVIDSSDSFNPLVGAVRSKNYKIVLYLLNQGADYTKPIFHAFSGEIYYIQNSMKRDLISLSSEAYQDKLKVIRFLEDHGVDYLNTPPPKRLIERAKQQYPDTWEEYLKVY